MMSWTLTNISIIGLVLNVEKVSHEEKKCLDMLINATLTQHFIVNFVTKNLSEVPSY